MPGHGMARDRRRSVKFLIGVFWNDRSVPVDLYECENCRTVSTSLVECMVCARLGRDRNDRAEAHKEEA